MGMVQYVSLSENNLSRNSLDLVDLGWWMQAVAGKFPEIPRLAELHSAYEKIRSGIVLDRFVGKCYLDNDNAYPQKFGYSGISVFYPETNVFLASKPVTWCLYFGGAEPDSFQADSGWGVFLKNYFSSLADQKSMPVLGGIFKPVPPTATLYSVD
jgi:hypothetical protein